MQFIPGGFGFAGQFFGAIAAGLFFIVVVVVVLGVLFVLVRFLMAATRAAETYVRVHELPKDETVVTAPDAPTAKSADAKTPDAPTAKAPATTPPVPAASSTSAATTPLPTVTKPVTKTPRTPKAPPPAI
jgi:predicted lipid-binding transport protein (Tim44 family)